MPYSNLVTDACFDEINLSVSNPVFNGNNLRQKINLLDYNAICEVDNEGLSLLHHTLALPFNTPSVCCFVITLLIQKAIQIDASAHTSRNSATAWLLTEENTQGLSPFYQALFMHADPIIVQTLSVWIAFSLDMKYLSIEKYHRMHNNPNNMMKLVSGGYAPELQLFLEELAEAIHHKWITTIQYKALFLPLGDTETKQLSKVCESECRETLYSLFLSLVFDSSTLSMRHNLESTLIFSLIDFQKYNQVEALLFAVCDAINIGAFPASIINNILLGSNHSGFRVLDRALKAGNYKSLQLVLDIASIAFKQEWININQYNHFLINHVNYQQGFSPLHEVLILKPVDIECTLLYLNEVLNGILQGVISFEQFRELLTQYNGGGYQPIHQAINNASFDKTSLFLNIYKWFFSQKDYDAAIFSRPKSGKKVICYIEHPDEKKITALFNNEKKQALARKTQTTEGAFLSQNFMLIKPASWSLNFIQFIALINQVLSLEAFQFGHTTSGYEKIEVVTLEADLQSGYSCNAPLGLFFSTRERGPLDNSGFEVLSPPACGLDSEISLDALK